MDDRDEAIRQKLLRVRDNSGEIKKFQGFSYLAHQLGRRHFIASITFER